MPARSPRVRSPAPDVDRALLEAALRLLGRGGLAALTHRAVAREAGTSLGSVTYRYPTIEALLDAALDGMCKLEIAELERLALELQGRAFDVDEWARAFAKALAGNVRREREIEIAGFELMLDAARHPRLRGAVRETTDAYQRIAELALRAAGSREPQRHARVLVVAITGIVLHQLAEQRPHFEAELAITLRDLVRGLVAGERS